MHSKASLTVQANDHEEHGKNTLNKKDSHFATASSMVNAQENIVQNTFLSPSEKSNTQVARNHMSHMQHFSSYLWGFLGALGLWLGFPNAVMHIAPAVLLYPLALYALGTKASTGKEALRHGWLTGLLGASAALYWLAIPIKNVGGLPWPLAIPCALFIGAYVGLYGGLFSFATWYLKNKESFIAPALWQRVLALACIWYALEILRGVFLTGFPWLSLSSAFAPIPLFIQGASVVGAYALSAWYTLMVLWLWEGITCYTRTKNIQKSALLTGSAVTLLAVLLTWGHASLKKESRADKAFSVIMVEGNVDQNIKWEAHHQQATLDLYAQLSKAALADVRAKDKAAMPLLIWPETAMPFYLEMHPVLGPALRDFIIKNRTPLLVGAPAAHVDALGNNSPFNRAYLIDETGTMLDHYDKVHLVPFGEYVPSWLQWNFLEALLQGIGTFTPGKHAKPLRYDSLAMGILLCYESIFPHLAQERSRNGANVFVNLSNDGWFGDSSAPQQHLQLATMRAVEQGRWIVRSTNTGISAIIDAQGRIRTQGAQFKEQSLLGTAYTEQKHSIFNRIYSYIPYIFLVLFVFALIPWQRKNFNKKI